MHGLERESPRHQTSESQISDFDDAIMLMVVGYSVERV